MARALTASKGASAGRVLTETAAELAICGPSAVTADREKALATSRRNREWSGRSIVNRCRKTGLDVLPSQLGCRRCHSLLAKAESFESRSSLSSARDASWPVEIQQGSPVESVTGETGAMLLIFA